MSLQKTRISHVRLAAFSACAAALLAVPLGAVLTSSEPASDPHPPQKALAQAGTPVHAKTSESTSHRVVPPSQTKRSSPKSSESKARAQVKTLASLSRERLVEVAKAGSQVERLAAVNLLWVRGDRQQVEQLAAKDRVLSAKVAALKKAGR